MYAKVNDVELYYELEGDENTFPCLIMHGGLGIDHTHYKPWVTPLTEKMRLIYYDHRGNGRSELCPPETYTHQTFVEDGEALRQYLGLDKFVLLGSSYGGILALEYAVRYPKNISHLILHATAPSKEFWNKARDTLDEKGTEEMKTYSDALFDGGFKDDDHWKAGLSTLTPLYFHDYDLKALEESGVEAIYRHEVFNYTIKNEMPKYDVRSKLKNIKVPTLILAGRNDWITTTEEAVEIHEGIEGSKLVIFDSGHFTYIEEQEKFIRTVLDWLSEHE